MTARLTRLRARLWPWLEVQVFNRSGDLVFEHDGRAKLSIRRGLVRVRWFEDGGPARWMEDDGLATWTFPLDTVSEVRVMRT